MNTCFKTEDNNQGQVPRSPEIEWTAPLSQTLAEIQWKLKKPLTAWWRHSADCSAIGISPWTSDITNESTELPVSRWLRSNFTTFSENFKYMRSKKKKNSFFISLLSDRSRSWLSPDSLQVNRITITSTDVNMKLPQVYIKTTVF